MCKSDDEVGTLQKTFLSSTGLGALLNLVPQLMMALEVVTEDGEGEMIYPLQLSKRVRCGQAEGGDRGGAVCFVETIRDGSVAKAFTLTMNRLEVDALLVHTDEIKATLHNVAEGNGLLPAELGVVAPLMMTVYKYLLHDKNNAIQDRGVWCPSRAFARYEGVQKKNTLSATQNGLLPFRMDIWQKKVRVPSFEELKEQVMMFLLKFGVEQGLRMECFACSGEGDDEDGEGDVHTCAWPESSSAEERLSLLNSVGVGASTFQTFIIRVLRFLAGEQSAAGPIPANALETLRQKCTTHVLNGRMVSVELDHLMRNLSKIEGLHNSV